MTTAKCECCGMSEDYTRGYIRHVRDNFLGKMICGLCSEAVKEDREKNGGRLDEALASHMSVCMRFNKIERAHPMLGQVQGMKVLLKKLGRSKSYDLADGGVVKRGGIARSSSCIPAITERIAGKYEDQETARDSC